MRTSKVRKVSSFEVKSGQIQSFSFLPDSKVEERNKTKRKLYYCLLKANLINTPLEFSLVGQQAPLFASQEVKFPDSTFRGSTVNSF